MNLLELSVSDIRANPDQPRKHFEKAAMAELVASVRSLGVVEPIIVRATVCDAGECCSTCEPYTIVAGERRWRAAGEAGLATIPAVVRELSDRDGFLISVVENVLRSDMNPVEECNAYQRLLDEGLTIEDLAAQTGKSAAAIRSSLSLLKLDVPIRELVEKGSLSAWDGTRLATLGINGQHRALRLIQTQGLTGNDRDRVIGQLWLAEREPEMFADLPKEIGAAAKRDLAAALHTAAAAVGRAHLLAGTSAPPRPGWTPNAIIGAPMDAATIQLVEVLGAEVARLLRHAKLSRSKTMVQETLRVG